MHEMSIAMSIVELAVGTAQAQGARAITGIELEVGALAGVLPEALEFCFAAAARDTLAQGAELSIRCVPARGRCPECGNEAELSYFACPCPRCGAMMVNLSQGRELRLCAITIED